MIGKRVESHFAPGFSVERRNLIQGKQVTLGGLAPVEVQQDDGLSVAPWRQVLFFHRRAVQLEGRICRDLHCLRREQSRSLMMSVTPMHAAPAIDHNVRAKSANHADHIFENLVPPNFFGFFGSFRIAEIFGTSEIEFHAIPASGSEQFLRANQPKLRGLFRAEVVLSAFAACQGEQSDVGVQPAGKIGKHRSALIVRMSRHEQDSRGNSSAFDRLNRFRQSGPCPRRWRKLPELSNGQEGSHPASDQDKYRQTLKIGIHATSTARQLRILTVNRQLSTANFQRAIVSLPARESETPEPPARSPPIPIFASPRSAKRATPTRSSSAPPAADTATS